MNHGEMEAYLHRLYERQKAATSSPQGEANPADGMSQVLVFSVGGREYAVSILMVKAVLALPPVTPLPFLPAYHKGAMNLRGQIVSIVDLREKMKVAAPITGDTSVVVLQGASFCMGVVVDSITRVLDVSPQAELGPVTLLDVERTLEELRS